MVSSLSLQKKLVLFITAIVVVVLMIVIFIIYPTIKEIISLQKSVAATEQYLAEQYSKTQFMRRSVRELDNVLEEIKKYENYGVRKGDELTLITHLEQLADLNHIDQNLSFNYVPEKPKALSADTTKKTSSITRPHYTLSFVNNGYYIDQLKYFRALEELPYYIIINSIQFDKPTKNTTSSSTPIIARINAIVYENSL